MKQQPSMERGGIDLGGVVFHPDLNRICRGDEVIRLSPKSSAVLRLLIDNAGQVMRRDEILDRVWVGRFPTDDVLTHAVTEIRRALDDDPASPRFIETIPKSGYRMFIAPVVRPSLPRKSLAALATTLGIIGLAVWILRPGNASRLPLFDQAVPLDISVGEPRPLIDGPDNEYLGSVSTDGAWLAFAEVTHHQTDLVLQHVATGEVRRLTDTPDVSEGSPTWAPHAHRLVYREVDGDRHCRLVWLDVESGDSELLHDGCFPATRLEFTPDGNWLAFTAKDSDDDTPINLRNLAIYRVRSNGDDLERMTFAETATRNDIRPRFSPDGRWLAFLRTGQRHDRRLMMQRVGQRRAQVVNTDSWITSFDWHPNGQVLIMSAHRSELDQLEAMDLASGAITSLDQAGVDNVVIHPDGRQIIYQQHDGDSDIWRVQLDGTGWGRPDPFITGEGYDFEPSVSPDGRWLAYCSTRSGLAELYVRNMQSGEDRQLTDRTGGGPAKPVWSPDSRHIAFLVQHDKASRVWLADVHESRIWPVEALASDPVGSLSWSGLDHRLYYVSERSGNWRLWRMDMDGGPREQVSDEAVRRVQVSSNGTVYFSREEGDALYRIPPGSRTASVAADGLLGLRGNQWAVAGGLVYFAAESDDGEGMHLEQFDMANQSLKTIAVLGRDSPALGDITVSPDGRMVFFDRLERWNTDVFLTDLSIEKNSRVADR